MLRIEDERAYIFRPVIIYFSDHPKDIEDCDAVRYPFCKNKVDEDGFSRSEALTSTIDLTQDLETIWDKIDRKSTRYSINKAYKYQIEVKKNSNYEDFFNLYKEFVAIKGFGSLFDVGIQKLKTIEKWGTLFTSEYKGELLGGHLYLEDNDNILLWISASKRLTVDKDKARLIGHANRLVHWEAIKYAKKRGIREFNWGGLWPEECAKNDNEKRAINSFKLSFGGDIVTSYTYNKFYSKSYKALHQLYKKMVRV